MTSLSTSRRRGEFVRLHSPPFTKNDRRLAVARAAEASKAHKKPATTSTLNSLLHTLQARSVSRPLAHSPLFWVSLALAFAGFVSTIVAAVILSNSSVASSSSSGQVEFGSGVVFWLVISVFVLAAFSTSAVLIMLLKAGHLTALFRKLGAEEITVLNNTSATPPSRIPEPNYEDLNPFSVAAYDRRRRDRFLQSVTNSLSNDSFESSSRAHGTRNPTWRSMYPNDIEMGLIPRSESTQMLLPRTPSPAILKEFKESAVLVKSTVETTDNRLNRPIPSPTILREFQESAVLTESSVEIERNKLNRPLPRSAAAGVSFGSMGLYGRSIPSDGSFASLGSVCTAGSKGHKSRFVEGQEFVARDADMIGRAI